MRRLLIPVLLGLLVGACGILGPDEKLVVGVLALHNPLVIPDSVGIGEAFTVTVTTVGSRSCTRTGKTEVKIQDNIATITPYDYEDVGADVCTTDLYRFTHEATVRFLQVGEALIVIRSRASHARQNTITKKWPLHVY